MDSRLGSSRVMFPFMLMYKVPGVIMGVGNKSKLLNITDLFSAPEKRKETLFTCYLRDG